MFLSLLSLFNQPIVYKADAPITINQRIEQAAEKYDVSSDLMKCLVIHETSGTLDPTIQSKNIYTFTDAKRGIYAGERERSFGLSQISLPHHPEINMNQATSASFALDFMASEISKGRSWEWSTLKFCTSSKDK